LKEKATKSFSQAKTETVPEIVRIEMTPKLYNAIKAQKLKQVNPLARRYVNTYFEWLKTIKPEEIIDGITLGITPEQAYHKLGANPIRIGVAAARAFLKTHPRYALQLRQIANLDLAITTLKYENPNAYAIIQKYGDTGKEYLKNWINGTLQILGAMPKTEAKQAA